MLFKLPTTSGCPEEGEKAHRTAFTNVLGGGREKHTARRLLMPQEEGGRSTPYGVY
jgi:hypothetical protein